MNAEIKQKWVAALRSGEYQQARGRLRVGPAFCCLGVLECIVRPDQEWDSEREQAMMPIADVLDAAGLSTDSALELADRNDGAWNPEKECVFERHSFAEIADYIEANL